MVVYTFHPGAQTLHEAHVKPSTSPPVMTSTSTAALYNPPPRFPMSQSTPFFSPQASYNPSAPTPTFQAQMTQPAHIPIRTLWSYIVQIASALQAIHSAGLAARTVDLNKIIITGKNRIRLGGCGVLDIVHFDSSSSVQSLSSSTGPGGTLQNNGATSQGQLQEIHFFQQEDLHAFGRLIFSLCTLNSSPSSSSGSNFQKSLEIMGRVYGSEIKNVALYLISKGGVHKVCDQCQHLEPL